MKPSAAIASCILATLSVSALSSEPGRSGPPDIEEAVHAVILPGTEYTVVPGIRTVEAGLNSWDQLQDAIAAWLSFEFELPRTDERAAIALVPAVRMASVRFRDVRSDRWPNTHEIVAVYDTEARTIYLPDGWTGSTPAELSVLVHEMVHHLQNVGGLTYACPEARERTAYTAQERFLGMFGGDLQTDFQIDGLTVFVRTNCLY